MRSPGLPVQGLGRVLNITMLGTIEFAKLMQLQRKLVHESSENRHLARLILCEHPPSISIGRTGSLAQIDAESEIRSLPIHWVNRGGGCMLHAPGQVMCYAVLALDFMKLNLAEYLNKFHRAIQRVIVNVGIPAEIYDNRSGIWVGDRRIAHLGIAIEDWVACFGVVINVDTDLEPFHAIACDGYSRPMTSIEREKRGRSYCATVRQRVIESFTDTFEFERFSLTHGHPIFNTRVNLHAVASSFE